MKFCNRSAHPRDQSQSRYNIRHSSGILMAEDEKIFQNLDEFCRRIEQVLDMTITLNQFSQYLELIIKFKTFNYF